MIFENVAFGG